jgi:hypothetical protein
MLRDIVFKSISLHRKNMIAVADKTPHNLSVLSPVVCDFSKVQICLGMEITNSKAIVELYRS